MAREPAAAGDLTGACAECGGPRRPEYELCWDCFRQTAGTCAECGGICGPGRELCRRCYMQKHELSECPRCNRIKPQRFVLCYSCEFGPRPGEPLGPEEPAPAGAGSYAAVPGEEFAAESWAAAGGGG